MKASDSTKVPIPLALVTGGSRRVGRSIALHLAHRGYAVAVHYYKSEKDALKTCREIEREGVPAFPLSADLTRYEEITSVFSQLRRLNHPLKITVNSAGLMQPSNLTEMTGDQWDRIMALNARAVWQCSKESAELMTDGGIIINISDVGVQLNWTKFGGYLVSKAAVESLTRLMASTLSPRVRVCGIAPGLLLKNDDLPDEEWQRLVKKIPFRRGAGLNELCELVDFLIDNEYITGEIITMAGGYQLG